jgi:hypothetical protein
VAIGVLRDAPSEERSRAEDRSSGEPAYGEAS